MKNAYVMSHFFHLECCHLSLLFFPSFQLYFYFYSRAFVTDIYHCSCIIDNFNLQCGNAMTLKLFHILNRHPGTSQPNFLLTLAYSTSIPCMAIGICDGCSMDFVAGKKTMGLSNQLL